MTRPRGGVAVVLHSHLPFVLNHGTWPHGADWLNEAAAETYLPMLMALQRLERDGVPFKLNIGLTPVLCEQLDSPRFTEEFNQYLEQKIEAARENEAEFVASGQAELATLARGWRGYYQSIRHEFTTVWHGRVLDGYRHFAATGHLDILTCAATHGYLPLLGRDTAVQAQVRAGVETHRRHFGSDPKGIWLPECAYRPRYAWSPPVGPRRAPEPRKGVDEFLSEHGIRYFIVDTHLLRGGQAMGLYLSRFDALRKLWARYERSAAASPVDAERTPHRPYWVNTSPDGHAPVAMFTRDPDTGVVVWSGEHGYPGDGWYLDFHKKHFPGGLRYWRVTGPKVDLGAKQRYAPERVADRLEENATHFVDLTRRLVAGSEKAAAGHRVVLTAPYDAELYGHWWFEGVRWLELVLRKLAADPELESVRLSEELEQDPPEEVVALPEGSWGQGGFHWIWLNELTSWTWEKIYPAEDRMERLARELARIESTRDPRAPALRSTLNLLARELLLLEASDWQFLISTVSARDYAELRLNRHADDFAMVAGVAEKILAGDPLSDHDRRRIDELEDRDFPFREADPLWWAGVDFPAS